MSVGGRYRLRVIDDLDILRAANILIKRYGADAAIEAGPASR